MEKLELIKVTQQNGEQLVSARELHKKLEVTERFNSWFERMLKYGFIENVDYTGCKVFNTLAKQELDEYILKLDTAKQICMLQRSELGTKFRMYFIECEKQLKQQFKVPTTFKEALQLALEQQEIIKKQQPKVDYYDTVLQSDKLVTTTEIAKDLGMSAVTLHSILHDLGIIYKKGKTWLLYEKYQKRVPEFCDYSISKYGQTLKWTEKGREWLIELLESEKR